MKPFVVGTPEDVAGFGLAGVEGVVCATRDEAAAAIANADDDAVVFVSGSVAPEVLAPTAPLVVVLPSR
jgi:vacuolar-type H+-ATPase subunit F/Vma7